MAFKAKPPGHYGYETFQNVTPALQNHIIRNI